MTSLHLICSLSPPPPPNQKSWLRLCLVVIVYKNIYKRSPCNSLCVDPSSWSRFFFPFGADFCQHTVMWSAVLDHNHNSVRYIHSSEHYKHELKRPTSALWQFKVVKSLCWRSDSRVRWSAGRQVICQAWITGEQGMIWNEMEDDFFIFHCGNFLPYHTKIFHSMLKFSSIFPSTLSYLTTFRLEAMQRIVSVFAMM